MPKNTEKKESTGEKAEGFLGGLFKGLGNLVDLAVELEKKGGEIHRHGEIKSIGKRLSSLDQLRHVEKKDVRGVYGFTIRTGIAGKGPRVESFGNMKKTPRGPTIERTREPIVDVFEEKDQLLLVVEIPGVEEESIKVTLTGRTFTVSAGKGDLSYCKEVTLPSTVDPESKKQSYKNGILKVEFKRMKRAAGKKK